MPNEIQTQEDQLERLFQGGMAIFKRHQKTHLLLLPVGSVRPVIYRILSRLSSNLHHSMDDSGDRAHIITNTFGYFCQPEREYECHIIFLWFVLLLSQ